MGNPHNDQFNLTTTVPRLLLLLALVIGTGIAQATPLHYSFDLGTAGSGDFTIKSDATPSVVDVSELASFNWQVSGVGAFDLADLSSFSLSNFSPLTGVSVNNSGWVSLGFMLKSSTLSDTGVACVTCFTAAKLALPGTTAQGTESRTRIRAAGSPCGTGLCVGHTPSLNVVPERLAAPTVAPVPEPSALSLAGLALLGLPLLKRRARHVAK